MINQDNFLNPSSTSSSSSSSSASASASSTSATTSSFNGFGSRLNLDNVEQKDRIAFLAQDLLNDLEKFNQNNHATNDADNSIPDYVQLIDNVSSSSTSKVATAAAKIASNKNATASAQGKKRKANEAKIKNNKSSNKPKKTKNQFQRKNIKKILKDNQLNESTLKALQAEQERQLRLNGQQAFESKPNYLTNNNSNGNNKTASANSSLNKSSDQSVMIVEEKNNGENEDSDDGDADSDEDDSDDDDDDDDEGSDDDDSDIVEDDDDIKLGATKIKYEKCYDDDDIIPISASSYTPNNKIRNSAFNSLRSTFGTNGGDDEDDDDCQIISESEHMEDQLSSRKFTRGLHMNDELNVPDQHGQVLINLNHPADDADVYLLPFLAKNIKSHQIGGIRFIYDNIVENLTRVKDKTSGFGCILAHAMGLGKTFQVISFVEVFLRCTSCKRVLCIVPINTIQNWQSEFNYWLPESGQQKLDNDTIINYQRPFKVYLINDLAKSPNQRIEIILDWRKNGGVLLMGYEMYRTLITLKSNQKPQFNSNTSTGNSNSNKKNTLTKYFQSQNSSTSNVIDLEEEDKQINRINDIEDALLNPCLVVCDEGHRIKNSSAGIAKSLQKIRTKRRIVLTGYPLQNNLIEYWCMVDFVRPAYLGTKSEFSNMFERPIMNGQCMDSTKEDIKLMRYRAHVLHSLLEGFVQRRGHDVFLSTLPKKQEFIILSKLSAVQKELYLAFMESIGAMNPGEKTNPLRTFAICCKIWNHPDVLYKLHMNKEAEMDLDLPDFQQQQTKSAPSSNKKASASSSNYLPASGSSSSCVMLEDSGFNPFAGAFSNETNRGKFEFDPDWANRIMDTYQPNMLENGAKFMISFSIINESVRCGDKILLFSQSLLSLNLIEDYLQKMTIPNTNQKWQKYKSYFRLDGSTSGSEREKLINQFNKPNNGVWLFLLSTRAGCLGINLIGANRVIVLDASWNPCHDAQAVCRVYRYGQTKNCFIYRLIADHTMEKKIYDRQISKQTMSDRVIDEIQTENHFTRTEVLKLVHYVKEDVEPADLTHMESRFDDGVLVTSCLRHKDVITKEPFTHESLLIDKKEYQLSEREKETAFREYQQDKRYFPCARSNSYNYLRYQLGSSTSAASFAHSPFNVPSTGHLATVNHSASMMNLNSGSLLANTRSVSSVNLTNMSSSSSSSSSSNLYNLINQTSNSLDFCINQNPCVNSAPKNHLNTNVSSSNSSSIFGNMHSYSVNSVPNVVNTVPSTSHTPVISQAPTTSSNSNSNNNGSGGSPGEACNFNFNQNQNLKDIKITSFVSKTQISIPIAVNDPSSSPGEQSILIQPGEKVFIFKTPKGCFLRTPDKRYIALKNKSLEESIMGPNVMNLTAEIKPPSTSFPSSSPQLTSPSTSSSNNQLQFGQNCPQYNQQPFDQFQVPAQQQQQIQYQQTTNFFPAPTESSGQFYQSQTFQNDQMSLMPGSNDAAANLLDQPFPDLSSPYIDPNLTSTNLSNC